MAHSFCARDDQGWRGDLFMNFQKPYEMNIFRINKNLVKIFLDYLLKLSIFQSNENSSTSLSLVLQLTFDILRNRSARFHNLECSLTCQYGAMFLLVCERCLPMCYFLAVTRVDIEQVVAC